MSVPVRSATELAETIKYCSGLLADCAEEDGVRADILAATAALVALADEEQRERDEIPSDFITLAEMWRAERARAEAAEALVAELETALREIANLSSQDVPFTAAEGSAGVMRKIARRALLAAGSTTGQEQQPGTKP